MHHRKDIWGDDADEFRPERWDDGDGPDTKNSLSSLLAHRAYSPFGAGARICIGQQLAQTETIYTTFRLARKFSAIQPADSRAWTENLGLATSPANGTRVRLI